MTQPAPTTDRRMLQDYRLDKLESHAETTEMSVRAIESAMLQIRDSMEASAREASEYRRETRRDIRCIHDTWSKFDSEFGPMLKDMKQKGEESTALRKHVKFAWLTAAGLAAGGVVSEFIRRHWGA